MVKVSVIIPCFNQGNFVDEAVESVLNQSYQNFEIIIVNDGSTEENTNKKLMNYKKSKTKVIHTTNQGLAAARNNGIKEAKGELILPLDSDDKIGERYLEKAVKKFTEDSEIGICYCKAGYFGGKKGEWVLPDYSLNEILIKNMIFCSALFRREDWIQVRGYKLKMKYGWEDWDFWLSLIELGRKIYRIPEILFFYRIRNDSMVRSISVKKKVELHTLLFQNHKSLYIDNINVIFDAIHNNKELLSIKKSFSYRLGRILTKPSRLFQNTLKKF